MLKAAVIAGLTSAGSVLAAGVAPSGAAPSLPGGERPASRSDPSTTADRAAWAHDAERELRHNILPFWLEHARDRRRGGFHGRIGPELEVESDAPRGVLLTSRLLWTFSAAHRRWPNADYLEMAQWALRELLERGWDKEEGGVFWTVDATGRPVSATKHVYNHSFAIYGLAEYHRATRDPEALKRAIALYRLVEEKARDHRHGGYFEEFTRDWRRAPHGKGSILGGTGPKSQNTHIHVLEAYTNLLRVWPDEGLKSDLRALLELMLTKIIDPRTRHLGLFFQDDWTLVSEEYSYGHDIELSWLVVEAATVLGDEALLRRAREMGLAMARVTLAEGVDPDGGVLNEGGPHGVTNANKDWWPQAEAVVGFLSAYQLSGEGRFYAQARKTWSYIQSTFIDRRHGDWHETVSREGKPASRPKLTPWKCPYHNARACLEVIERLEGME